MTDRERLEEIKRRLLGLEYFCLTKNRIDGEWLFAMARLAIEAQAAPGEVEAAESATYACIPNGAEVYEHTTAPIGSGFDRRRVFRPDPYEAAPDRGRLEEINAALEQGEMLANIVNTSADQARLVGLALDGCKYREARAAPEELEAATNAFQKFRRKGVTLPPTYDCIAAAINAAAAWRNAHEPKRRRWRHLKRGTSYVELARGSLQHNGERLIEGMTLIAYQSEQDGRIWFRRVKEFEDGRFEEIASSAEPAHEPKPAESEVEALKARIAELTRELEYEYARNNPITSQGVMCQGDFEVDGRRIHLSGDAAWTALKLIEGQCELKSRIAELEADTLKAERDALRKQVETLREALSTLLSDVQDYPAWERPCLAVDTARAALAATGPKEIEHG